MLEMAERSELKLLAKNHILQYFDAKLSFALLALIRSVISSDLKIDKMLVT